MAKHELVIIGGGPAALSAAIYASRAGLETVVYERGNIGGTLPEISQIDNYPGYQGSGQALAEQMRSQALSSGAKIEYGECTAVEYRGLVAQHRDLTTRDLATHDLETELSSSILSDTDSSSSALSDVIFFSPTSSEANFSLTVDAEPVAAQAVIIATGSAPRPLGFPLVVPVSYCALCDGALAREKDVAVVGGGNSAFQESLYLAGLVHSLTLITHSAAKADPWLQERLRRLPNVTIRENLEPTPELLNQFAYVFVYIGKQPATSMLQPLDAELQKLSQSETTALRSQTSPAPDSQPPQLHLLDAAGYIVAPDTQTALSGLFAAGDVRAGGLKQAIVAASDGAQAALAAYDYLHNSR